MQGGEKGAWLLAHEFKALAEGCASLFQFFFITVFCCEYWVLLNATREAVGFW